MRPGLEPGSRGPLILAALVAAACIVVSQSYRIFDPDLWQHLAVGRAIWQTHALPRTQVWTWPSYGAPAVLWSWGFRVLLWPFWSVGGVTGLFVWRWLTTLAAFGLVWIAARRMGALSLAGLVVFVLCGLVYRQRSMPRPETLAAVLFALEFLILETRRHGGRDSSPWLVGVLWLWVQVHVSFVWGFAVLGVYLVDELLPPSGPERPRGRAARTSKHKSKGPDPAPVAGPRPKARLAWVLGLSLVAAAINPYDVRLLLQPVDFFLHQRHEPLFQSIEELKPIQWPLNTRNGLPLLLVGWPALALWHPGRRSLDRVELALAALFTTLVVSAQRFIGVYALVAAPFLARDLAAWMDGRAARAARRGEASRGGEDPGLAENSWRSAVLVAVACVAISLPEWLRSEPPLGIDLDLRNLPVAACDFMATHGVRGRSFNYFHHGGYMLWRFWPDRTRLPFIDIHQTGTPELREDYMRALSSRDGFEAADARYHFDYLLLRREELSEDTILDGIEADSLWAPVFIDDATALYVRRGGPLAAVADSFQYRFARAGAVALRRLGVACATDSALRERVRSELGRELRESPRNALAHSLLANLALVEGRWDDAAGELEAARAVAPSTPRLYERLGLIAGARGRPQEAVRLFEREHALHPERPGIEYLIGKAYRELGDPKQARVHYLRELKRNPGHTEARDSLATLDGLGR